jgi:hypothetical protein
VQFSAPEQELKRSAVILSSLLELQQKLITDGEDSAQTKGAGSR